VPVNAIVWNHDLGMNGEIRNSTEVSLIPVQLLSAGFIEFHGLQCTVRQLTGASHGEHCNVPDGATSYAMGHRTLLHNTT
jgi:hypothetical protein